MQQARLRAEPRDVRAGSGASVKNDRHNSLLLQVGFGEGTALNLTQRAQDVPAGDKQQRLTQFAAAFFGHDFGAACYALRRVFKTCETKLRCTI